MASGFIVLRDGRCFAVHQPLHDAVVRSLLQGMAGDDPLRDWLVTQVPSEGDVELGYAFVRKLDGEHVARKLDVRGFTESNQATFERAALTAEPIAGPFAPLEQVASALERLREMIKRSRAGEPPLELSDWTTEAPESVTRIGPGWPDD